ncbi:MAG: acyl-CoA dehydrogenase family protein [Acidimicrobiia bacterium]|nr:acyl-CoA dehydrogenase family protein [Acidimicrobiia bacterium]
MADTATQAAIRREVRAWLDANWDPDRPLAEWRPLLADSGWGCPTWPVEWYGKGLSNTDAAVVTEEMRRAGAVGVAAGGGMSLAAATILAHGSDEVKAAHLRPIITGEHRWCQLFSEPGSGSDLAGLTTRAVLDGEEWIVNGQKVWNTGAHKAHYGMLLARTNWDVPKHRGITFFVLGMRQPGVEVRPLRQMNGHASFNEVFLTDARVPASAVVGEPELGWAVAITTLMHERHLTAPRGRGPRSAPEGRTRIEAAEEAAAYNATYSWYPQRAGRADLVTPRAEATGRIADPLVRQDMAALTAFRRATRWTAERARAARAAGRQPGPEGSLGKLSSSVVARRCNALHTAIAGAEGMLTGPDTAAGGMIAEVLISTPAQSIAGGTDEIQKNILGERMLGLPKEPSVDNDVPFHEVRINTSTRRLA